RAARDPVRRDAVQVDAGRRRRRPVARVAVAELAAVTAAPALELAVARERAGVVRPRRHVHHLRACVDIAREVPGELTGRVAPVRVPAEALAQLATVAAAPAPQRADLGQRAGVVLAGDELAHRTGQRHGRQAVYRLVVAEARRAAVAELPH